MKSLLKDKHNTEIHKRNPNLKQQTITQEMVKQDMQGRHNPHWPNSRMTLLVACSPA